MELVIRKHHSIGSAHKVNEDFNKTVTEAMMKMYSSSYWVIVVSDWDEEYRAISCS